MKRRYAALFIPLFLTAAVSAQEPETDNWIKRVIEKYGTYLMDTEPMACGTDPLGEESILLIKNLFQKTAQWPNFRGKHTMGIWKKDVARCPVPMISDRCTEKLWNAGVYFKELEDVQGIMDPVEITSEINGVTLVSEDPLVMDCHLALALEKMTGILAEKGIEKIGVMSLHRPESQYSFHAFGLAVDVSWFKWRHWSNGVWVYSWFEKRTTKKTCDYTPVEERGKRLMDVACTIWEENLFNTVLTPNYNDGHYNHFHLDVRPGDNRFYLN